MKTLSLFDCRVVQPYNHTISQLMFPVYIYCFWHLIILSLTILLLIGKRILCICRLVALCGDDDSKLEVAGAILKTAEIVCASSAEKYIL
jgi:hypothetical protein